MLMLHAGLVGASLLLWGEAAHGSQAENAYGTATGSMLVEALHVAFPQRRAARLESRGVVAWLPSLTGKLVPSSPLLDVAMPSGSSDLAPHALDALQVDAETLDLLLGAAERPLLAPGILVGDDLAFWSRALTFALRLVAAQRYVPSVGVDGSGRKAAYYARWRATLGPDQRAAFAALAEAMPGACRALGLDERRAPARAKSDVLRTFIDGSVDRLVRAAASRAKIAPSDGALHDRWLRALCGADAGLAGNSAGMHAFADSVGAWMHDVSAEDDAPYRLFLRLEEPAGDGLPWFVRHLLQSQSDRSLLVAGDAAWKSATLRPPMLAAVGRAARVSPHIDATLREKRPEGFGLDDADAHAFLTQDAPLLESAGLGLMLPAWWTNRGTKLRLGVQAHIKAQKGPRAGLRLGAIVAVDWKVALGGEVLTARELAELARLKSPLVRLRGQWVAVAAGDIRAALALRERRTESMQLGDVVRMSLTGRDPTGQLPVDGVAASGDVKTLRDRLGGRAAFESLRPPGTLRATLRPYQERGYSWLRFHSGLGLGACLADDMGLGKTIQTLSLFAHDWADGVRRPVLLICPTSVIRNWQREARAAGKCSTSRSARVA